METLIFFINAGLNPTQLMNLADTVFRCLDIGEWEERFSANYPPKDHYFAGYTENAEIEVYDSDDLTTPDYPFRISVKKATWRIGRGIIVTEPSKIAELLATCGFAVFIPSGAWYRTDWDGQGEFYAAKKGHER